MLSLIALVEVVFTENFKPGNMVDLSQGYYVCQTTPESGLLEKLLGISDIDHRRQVAKQNKCMFRDDGNPVVRKVRSEVSNVCLDKEVGFQHTQHGVEDTIMCGREGHEFITNQGETIYWISLDIDFD